MSQFPIERNENKIEKSNYIKLRTYNFQIWGNTSVYLAEILADSSHKMPAASP